MSRRNDQLDRKYALEVALDVLRLRGAGTNVGTESVLKMAATINQYVDNGTLPETLSAATKAVIQGQ